MLDLARGSYGDNYASLPLCAIDAVVSIGVRYQRVRNVIGRYCAETLQAVNVVSVR